MSDIFYIDNGYYTPDGYFVYTAQSASVQQAEFSLSVIVTVQLAEPPVQINPPGSGVQEDLLEDQFYIDEDYFEDGYFVYTAVADAVLSSEFIIGHTTDNVFTQGTANVSVIADVTISVSSESTLACAADIIKSAMSLSDQFYIDEDYFEEGYFVYRAVADAVLSSEFIIGHITDNVFTQGTANVSVIADATVIITSESTLACAAGRLESVAATISSEFSLDCAAVRSRDNLVNVSADCTVTCAAAKIVSVESIQLSVGSVSLQANVTSSASTDLSVVSTMLINAERVQTANITLETIVTLSLQADKFKGTTVELAANVQVAASAIRYISFISTSPTPFRARVEALISTEHTQFGTHSLLIPTTTSGASTTSTHTKFNIPSAETNDLTIGEASRFEIAFWFRPTATPTLSTNIISFGTFNTNGSWSVRQDTSRRIIFSIRDAAGITTSGTTSGSVTNNQWNFVQISREWFSSVQRGRLTIRINGSRVFDQLNFNRGSGTDARTLHIGSGAGLVGFRGYIDGLKIDIGRQAQGVGSLGGPANVPVPTEDTLFGNEFTKLLMNWNDNPNGNWFDDSLSSLEIGAAALSSTATVTADVVKTANVGAALNSTATVVAQVVKNISVEVNLNSTATLSVSTKKFTGGAAALSSTFTVTASGLDLDLAEAALQATSTVSVSADRTRSTTASLNSNSEITTTIKKTVNAVANLSATGFVLSIGLRLKPGAAALTSVSTLSCEAETPSVAEAVLTSQFNFTATPNRSFPRPLDLTLLSNGFSLDTNNIYSNIRFVEFQFGVSAFTGPTSRVDNILVLGNQFTVELEYQAAPNRNYLRLNGVRAAGTQGEDGDLAVPPSASIVAIRTVRIVKINDIWTLTSTGAPGTITVSRTQADSYSGTISASRPPNRQSSMTELVFAGPTASLVNLVSSNPFVFSDQSNIQGLYHSPYNNSADDVSIRQLGNAALTTISQLNVAPIYNLGFSAALNSQSSIIANVTAVIENGAAISSESQVNCVSKRIRFGSLQAQSISSFNCDAGLIKGSAVSLNSTASVTIIPSRILNFEISTESVASQLTVAVKTGRILVTMECSSIVAATAVKSVDPVTLLSSVSTAEISAVKTTENVTALTTNATVLCNVDRFRLGAAAFVSTSSTTIAAVKQARGISNMLAVTEISANPFGLLKAEALLTSESTVVASSIITARATSNLQVQSTQVSNINKIVGFECNMLAFNAVLAIGTKVTLDPYYQLSVPRELRIKTIAQETRILSIDSENRLNTIQAQNRLLIVPSETRVWHIPYSPTQGIRRVK